MCGTECRKLGVAEQGCSSIPGPDLGDQGGMSLRMLARRAREWRSAGRGWFSGVWGSVNLPTCSPWAELPHRLTMEMLALEKRLYSGASHSSVEGVVTAANSGTCLSLNGVIAESCQCSRLFPGRKRGRKEGMLWTLLRAACCRQCVKS